MYKTNFRGLSLKAFNEREELNINSFKGVDYSSSAFNVSDNRAIDILNLIFKDNVIQKRKGFKHVLSLTEKEKIHNIIKFQDGYVIHCGTKLYVANESFEITTQVSNATLLDKKVTMLEKNNRLYVLSGIKYFYLDNNFVVHNCEDNAYIPTTTIGIVNSYNPSGTTNVTDGNRTSLDKVNNLSNLVINELISGTRINENTKDIEFNIYTKYLLDNDFDEESYKSVKVSIPELPICAKPNALDLGVSIVSNFHSVMVFGKDRTNLDNLYLSLSLKEEKNYSYIYEQKGNYTSQDEQKYIERYIVINPNGINGRYADLEYQANGISEGTIYPSGSRNVYICKSNDTCKITDFEVGLLKSNQVLQIKPIYEFSNKNINFLPLIFDNCQIRVKNSDDSNKNGLQGRQDIVNSGNTNWNLIFNYRYLYFTTYIGEEFVSGQEYTIEILDEQSNVLISKKVTV